MENVFLDIQQDFFDEWPFSILLKSIIENKQNICILDHTNISTDVFSVSFLVYSLVTTFTMNNVVVLGKCWHFAQSLPIHYTK